MVWPFWSSDPSTDSVKSLDPELRKFLEQEAPKPPPQPRDASADISYTDQLDAARTQHRNTEQQTQHRNAQHHTTIPDTPHAPKAPAASLFPDGRYAHLWTTYRPLSDIEAAQKTESEKLKDLVDVFESRKKSISATALENCALQAVAQADCFASGAFLSRLTMCRAETRALNRCTDMQAKFLRALGYLSVVGRAPEDEERVQMHADRLYQQMLEHEDAIARAKAQGQPVPEFRPVMSRENLAKVLGVELPAAAADAEKPTQSADDFSHVPEKLREEFRQSVKDKSREERAVEEAALLGEMRDRTALSSEAVKILEEDKRKRLQRWADGKPTLGDRMKRAWGGWDD
jgi:hypothetical protein